MIPAIDVQAELDDLAAALERFTELRSQLGGRAGERRPDVSGWSLEEHLYHLCLATDLALRNVLSLSRGKGRLIMHEGEANALAIQVLTEGCYPRGESVAPRMVQPPDPIDAGLLDQEIELLGQGLERTRALLATLPGAVARIPHQHLGALSASEWLRFARLHARHHLAIASELAD
ncbi:MAG: DinB family protein [Planctomycetota bacterium]|nr:DinB family protein [Planctomycetota bacterium]